MTRRQLFALLAAPFAAACTRMFRPQPTLRVEGFTAIRHRLKGKSDAPWTVRWEFAGEASYFHEAYRLNVQKMQKAVGQTVRDPRELLRHVR